MAVLDGAMEQWVFMGPFKVSLKFPELKSKKFFPYIP
jgi:hypothetical protein